MPPRRIAPTLVTDSTTGNIASVRSGTKAQQKYRDAIDRIAARVEAAQPKRKSLAEHGSHHRHLGDLDSYIAHYLRLIKHHGKLKQSQYDFLKRNHDSGRFYSVKTKRFRKVR
jgi:hypothetical protein